MKHLIAIAVAAIFITKSFAAGDGWCGSQKLMQQRLAENPALRAQMDEAIANYKANEARMGSGSRANGVIYVPVVFHIIHNGDAIGTGENISDEQILSQIDALNINFSHSNPDTASIPAEFKGLVKDTKIQFCLARFDPQGNPTTGIDRLQFNRTSWDSENDIETTLKPPTIWDRSKYLNIWSVRMGGALASGGTLAYATLPFFTNNQTDGVLSRYTAIGTTGPLLANYTLGRTIVHEVGHWLGLFHIWGNEAAGATVVCDNGANNYTTSDFIDDTPDQANLNFGCPSYPQFSCNTSNMFMNHMDYTDDDCRHLFSAGQGDRMYGVLTQGGTGNRLSISNSASKCFLTFDGSLPRLVFPLDTICTTTFSPIAIVKNVGFTIITSGTIKYSIDGGASVSIPWTGSLGTNEEDRVTLPQITTTAGFHNISVSFENPNNAGLDNDGSNDGNTFNLYVYEGGTGLEAPYTEDFETGTFPPVNYSIINGGSANTWKSSQANAYSNVSGFSAVIDNLNYASNPNRTKDALVTDDFDVRNLTAPKLSFDVAYARYNANRSDTLIVYYSLDCGAHYYQIYKNGGVSLSTAPDKTSAFVPSETEWKNISTALSGLKGQTKVRFKFENISGWGNALYLDNINVEQDLAAAIEESRPQFPISVYPNPASNMLSVKLPVQNPFVRYEIVNAIGQKVNSGTVTQHALILNTEDLKSGLYFIRLLAPNFTQHKSFVIAR